MFKFNVDGISKGNMGESWVGGVLLNKKKEILGHISEVVSRL